MREVPMRRWKRGYTIVELMMALAILAVSVSGVIAMQKVTVVSNTHARDVAVANRIAQAWLEQLRVDASLWNTPTKENAASDLNTTLWLGGDIPEGAEFILPSYNAARRFGPGFDALGRPVDHNATPNDVVFCTHVRLRRLTATTSTRGLMRVTVRVFWQRFGGARTGDTVGPLCNATVAAVSAPTNRRLYHTVYHTTVIRQHTTE